MSIATDTFEQLTEGLEAKTPCLIHEVLGSDDPCGNEAGRLVFWRNPCGNGKMVEPPFATALCRAHAQELVRGFDSGIFACEACDTVIHDSTHAIKRVEDL
jgi:hypothetical protein